MNVENMRAWVKALRSGEYKQTTEALRKRGSGGFCCLGVVCDISGLGVWKTPVKTYETEPKKSGYVFTSLTDSMNNNSDLTNTGVMEWLGMRRTTWWRHSDGFSEQEWQYLLVDMNDTGKSFDEIADFIEERINEYVDSQKEMV